MLKYSKIFKYLFRAIIISIFIFSNSDLYSQTYNQTIFNYVSPKPNSKNNSVSNNIIIYVNKDFNLSSVHQSSLIQVGGKIGGKITGSIITERQSIVFIPENNFTPGDEITVNFSQLGRLLGDYFGKNTFTFSVTEKIIKLNDDFIDAVYKDEIGNIKSQETLTDSLPSNYPHISVVQYDNPASGKLFFGVFGNTLFPSLLITESNLNPIFYRE